MTSSPQPLQVDFERVHKLTCERLSRAESEAVQWQVAYEQANEALARLSVERDDLRRQLDEAATPGPGGAGQPAGGLSDIDD